ncbi:AAA family ATPase, partial [Parabacteroides distasonis]
VVARIKGKWLRYPSFYWQVVPEKLVAGRRYRISGKEKEESGQAELRPRGTNLFDDISDLDDLLFQLQFHFQKRLIPRKSAIIFDEVQNCPMARQAIKKLVKDGRYDYIETGSLISIKK